MFATCGEGAQKYMDFCTKGYLGTQQGPGDPPNGPGLAMGARRAHEDCGAQGDQYMYRYAAQVLWPLFRQSVGAFFGRFFSVVPFSS